MPNKFDLYEIKFQGTQCLQFTFFCSSDVLQGGHITGKRWDHWDLHFLAQKHWETLGFGYFGDKNTGIGFFPQNGRIFLIFKKVQNT